VDLIDFPEPDEEIQEDIDIGNVNELPEQGESIGLEHLSNVNVETLSRLQREDPTLSQLDPHLHLNLGNVPHIPPFHSQSLHFACSWTSLLHTF
jgi:hypothetical protein